MRNFILIILLTFSSFTLYSNDIDKLTLTSEEFNFIDSKKEDIKILKKKLDFHKNKIKTNGLFCRNKDLKGSSIEIQFFKNIKKCDRKLGWKKASDKQLEIFFSTKDKLNEIINSKINEIENFLYDICSLRKKGIQTNEKSKLNCNEYKIKFVDLMFENPTITLTNRTDPIIVKDTTYLIDPYGNFNYQEFNERAEAKDCNERPTKKSKDKCLKGIKNLMIAREQAFSQNDQGEPVMSEEEKALIKYSQQQEENFSGNWDQEWMSRSCQPYCFTPRGPTNWQLRERARIKMESSGGLGPMGRLTKQESEAYYSRPKFLQLFR